MPLVANSGMAITNNVVLVIAALTILLPGNVNAFWRLECEGSVGLARMDPLINFGMAGDHAHSIKGGSGKFLSFRAWTSTSGALY